MNLSVVDEEAREAIRAARRAWYAEGTRALPDRAKPAARRAAPRMALRTLQTVQITTGTDGSFASDQLLSALFPVRVLAEVSYLANGVTVTSSRWGTATTAGAVVLEGITIPDSEAPGAQFAPVQTVTGDDGSQSVQGTSDDGTIQVENLPAQVSRLIGRSFNPGDQSGTSADEAAFPGEFAELGNVPLNSAAFVWMKAFDAEGNPVESFDQAARMRSLVPKTQWVDLEDLTQRTDRIEIPIYVYDEGMEMWEEQAATGWLEDEEGTVLGEDWQELILDGTFPGDLYAAWTTTHFSWMNVDYAYIGPWTLSRLSRDKRNNDCLYKASRLAEKIFRTSWANTAYADVNKPGSAENPYTLSDEVPDRGSTEFKEAALDDTTFGQTTASDFKELLHLNSKLWDNCDTKKKATIFAMAVTILHESAHWKHDVKKHDGTYADEGDVGGEGGLRIEKNLFGDSIWTSDGKLPVTGLRTGSGTAITDAQLDDLTDPQWWEDNEASFTQAWWTQYWASGGAGPNPPRLAARALALGENPLQIALSLDSSTFDLGAPIPVTVTYTNVGSETIEVLDFLRLQGYPFYFTVLDDQDQSVPFVGPKAKVGVADTDYVTLEPNATYQTVVDLTGDAELGVRYFNFTRSGDYRVTATYNDYWGLPETVSNQATFTLNPGGSLGGRVLDASSNTGVAGATVRVLSGDTTLATAVTSADGSYTVAELPPGVYDVQARTRGFVSETFSGVTIVSGEATTQDFLLTALLVSGQIRIVLTWGQSPSDLDSHLWLPTDVPYHLYYSTDGNQLDSDPEPDFLGCPYAMLDVDDTSSYGPETITILERVRSGEYVYAVRNFSGSPALAGSGAQVQVFDASGLAATFTVPAEGDGTWWHVLNIDGTTGAVTEVNTLGVSPAPYDGTSGCPTLPTVSFSESSQTVGEEAGTVTVTLTLSATAEQTVSLPFTVGGTATEGAGADFTVSASPAIIPGGQSSTTITLTLSDDAVAEGSETVDLTLGTPVEARPREPQVHTVTITDND